MKRSKRYLLTVMAALILSGIALLSVLNRMEGLASACVAGLMTILSTYIWGETRRPSNQKKDEKE